MPTSAFTFKWLYSVFQLGVGPIIVKSLRRFVESSTYSWRDVRGADTTRTLLLAAAGRDDKLSIHDHDTAHISLTPGITH